VLFRSTLIRSTLSGCDATGANFNRVVSFRTNFQNANLSNVTFVKSEMQRADFEGADLTGARFVKADLGRANFNGAILRNVSFERANISRIDFRSAKLEGKFAIYNAYLLQTNIEGVDFSGAEGLQQWQVDMSCGDDKTKLPDGLKASDTWPCPPDDDE